MKKIIIVIVLFGSFFMDITAQDIHYSQFYNMPLSLNPSLTGHLEGTYRIKGIYRNQWSSITSGGVYATPGLSLDANFKFNKKSANSLGAGIVVMNDKTGGGDFNNTLFMGAVAYHVALGRKKKTYFSIGVQGGMNSKRLNTQELIFENNLTGSGTTETFKNTSLSVGDIRAGATLAFYPSDRMQYKFGIAAMHLLNSQEVFLNGTTKNNTPLRIAFHGSGSFKNKSEKLRWLPHFLFMTQASVIEINTTLNVGYKITPDVELVGGAGYRMVDAAIVNLGCNYKGFQALVSYDFNLSKLTPSTNANGAYELSLGYIGSIKQAVKPTLPCVRYF